MNLMPFALVDAAFLLSAPIVGHPGRGSKKSAATWRQAAFALVMKADGSVVFWGRDADGQAAGPPSRTRAITTPVVIDLPRKALQVAHGGCRGD